VIQRAPAALVATAPTPAGPVAVVDIGSNSIRLVVYGGAERGAPVLFNEKVLCGLGRGLAASGRLNPDGVAMARKNLVRFTRLARAMGVARVDLIATAAVREAADGAAFAAEVEGQCGLPVQVLSGADEARLSALGVIAGFRAPSGLMGDLGGGSLELVEIRAGEVGRSVTLPLGPLRLIDGFGDNLAAMRREIDRHLATVDWLAAPGAGPRQFYAVGGAWRNLARIHIEQRAYPLHVIHGYRMRRAEVEDLARVITRLGHRSLARIEGVTPQRLETLPAGALALSRLVGAARCTEAVFSVCGLREGYAFDQLPPAEQARDPLLALCAEMGRREARFDDVGEELMAWTGPLFPGEDEDRRRLRHAACHLADIAWRYHPDYRAGQALLRILHYPLTGVDHAERVFLAYAVFVRYGGGAQAKEARRHLALLTHEEAERARVLGLALRLAYRVSGATRAVLARSALSYDGGELVLTLPDDGSSPGGEAVERRFAALADALGARGRRIDG
jgi:exopolyphosphatase/guanosine-5'-triphosphate,3'-diphosphate pyrophosphatase